MFAITFLRKKDGKGWCSPKARSMSSKMCHQKILSMIFLNLVLSIPRGSSLDQHFQWLFLILQFFQASHQPWDTNTLLRILWGPRSFALDCYEYTHQLFQSWVMKRCWWFYLWFWAIELTSLVLLFAPFFLMSDFPRT